MIAASSIEGVRAWVHLNVDESPMRHLEIRYFAEFIVQEMHDSLPVESNIAINPMAYGSEIDSVDGAIDFCSNFLEGTSSSELRRLSTIGVIVNTSSGVARFNGMSKRGMGSMVKRHIEAHPEVLLEQHRYIMMGMGPERNVMDLAKENSFGLIRKRELIS